MSIDILDALELLYDNSSDPIPCRIMDSAINEIERLRAVETAALSLVEQLVQEVPEIPEPDHPLIRAIRGQT